MCLEERIKAEQEYLDKWIEEHKDASTEEIEEFTRERVSTLPDRFKDEGIDYEAELKNYMLNRIKEDGIVGLLFMLLLFFFQSLS